MCVAAIVENFDGRLRCDDEQRLDLVIAGIARGDVIARATVDAIVARFAAAPADWTPVEPSRNRQSTSLFRDLAFDLDACQQQVVQLRAQLTARKQVSPLHPGLVRSGSLLTLTTSGPLGQAGDSLIMPDDQVMSPAVPSSWPSEPMAIA